MSTFASIARNFRFMLVQVRKQLEHTARLLIEPTNPVWVKAIRGSEGYIDTQKSMIENECHKFFRRTHEAESEPAVKTVRAVNVITSNLERIADFAVNITRQLDHLSDPTTLPPFSADGYIADLLRGLDLIERALFDRDSELALRICRVEDVIDQRYAADLRRILAELSATREVNNLVTVLFIVHYLERMGDALLNVGEAIIFAVLGERLKVHQYRALDDALTAAELGERNFGDVRLDSIWGTRSGVRIGKIESETEGGPPQRVLFKEGNPDKLRREHESLSRWEQVAPGLVPAVVEYHSGTGEATLLLQYLDGQTLQDIAVNAALPLVERAQQRLADTLTHLWTTSRTPQPVSGGFLNQVRTRLDDVYRLHPELKERGIQVGTLRVPSFSDRLADLADLDEVLTAPFSVFIHGDFNLDNIIYNPTHDSLHFVDVQRSREMDYVQDVSVFLVSTFRLPVFTPETRAKLERFALGMLRLARGFAAGAGDETFEARLALGLIRSFATSTRFEISRKFSHNMHHRALLLLNKLAEHRALGAPWSAFHVPDSVVLY